MLFPQVKEVSDNAHVGPTWFTFNLRFVIVNQSSGPMKRYLLLPSFFYFFFLKEKEEEIRKRKKDTMDLADITKEILYEIKLN